MFPADGTETPPRCLLLLPLPRDFFRDVRGGVVQGRGYGKTGPLITVVCSGNVCALVADS